MLSLAGALGSLPYVLAVVGALLAYNVAIENPSIRAEARAGMVAVAELAAAKAELKERERQAAAGLAASTAFAETLRAQSAELAKEAEAHEQELADFAARLKKEGRSCALSDADIRELRK